MKLKHNNKGFTLIEALFSMVVLAVGILALHMMHVSSTRGNSSANKITIATSSVSSIYEILLNSDYSSALMTAGNHNDNELIGNYTLPNNNYVASWTVTQWTNTDGVDNDGDGATDENDENEIKFVTLVVTYQDQAAKTNTINFLKSTLY
ncbi:MAG: prepilin-type N-terminal cleavage/methylation domain-containing protein [Desulfobacterales bacterium]|nr:prepilin-type N-terminal cleavage/methylation domain-containing protein [Desulfobacterales bacterium]